MRRLPPRNPLPTTTANRLARGTTEIIEHHNRVQRADAVYTNARRRNWFQPVTDALRQMAGLGERCMLCSGSECSQVEHFRPKALFPEFAMTWDNFLWVCGLCNLNKGDDFPLTLEGNAVLINPVLENVWEFFFIDEFGNLAELWRADLNDVDPRAKKTVEVLELDRDALQLTRQSRLINLKHLIDGALRLFDAGSLTTAQLRERIDHWLVEPFQPDIADYFFRGPGSTEQPFADVINKAQFTP